MSTTIGAFPFAEVAVAVLVEFRLGPTLLLRGTPCDRDQAQAASQGQIGAPSSWVRSMDGLGKVSSEHDIGRRSIHVRSRDAV